MSRPGIVSYRRAAHFPQPEANLEGSMQPTLDRPDWFTKPLIDLQIGSVPLSGVGEVVPLRGCLAC
jgi:hypothetical protein